MHEAARCLESGLGSDACTAGGSPTAGSWGGSLGVQQAARIYAGSSKHSGALFASAAAPRFLLLDFSRCGLRLPFAAAPSTSGPLEFS